MLIDPIDYPKLSPFDLLTAASKGRVGVDQRWLRALTQRPDETLPDLIRFSKRDLDQDPVNLEQEVIELFRHFRDPRAVPYYLEHMRLAGLEAEDDVLHGLADLGQSAVEPLIALYEEMGETDGGDVAFALAALGVRDDRILKILVERLEFDAVDGAMDLALYGDPAGIEVISQLMREAVPPGETDDYVQRNLEAALRDLRIFQTAALPLEEPFNLFERYPEVIGPDFDVMDDEDLLALLATSEDANVRKKAAAAFFNETLDDDLTNRLYQLALQDPDPAVRGELWSVLGSMADDKKVAATLRQRTSSDYPPAERAGALNGLSTLGDSPQFSAVALQLYQKSETRAKALEAMRRTLAAKYSKYFPLHLDDADPEVKRQAIWGVGYLEISSSTRRLQAFFEDEEFREDALYAYALAASIKLNAPSVNKLYEKMLKLAGGFSQEEAELVETALDERMALHGLPPVFGEDNIDFDEFEEDELDVEEEAAPLTIGPVAPALGPRLVPPPAPKPGRNDLCPCGSNKKYKKCCGAQ